MKPLTTLKMLLLALIMADLGLSSVIAQSSRSAFAPATTARRTSARGDARPASKLMASKSTHSLRRKHRRHHRRVVRKSRVHHRRQHRHRQLRHKGSVNRPKSVSQPKSPVQAR